MTPPPPSHDAKKKQSYVYFIQSQKDRKFYLGWTTDLSRRIGEHNEGLCSSTKSRRPFELVHFETYGTQMEAKNRERKLKKNPRMYKLFKNKNGHWKDVYLEGPVRTTFKGRISL